MTITPATMADLEALAALINGAYRPADGPRGWTDELDYIDGPRTTPAALAKDIARPAACMLVLRDSRGPGPLGCVFVEPAGEGLWYLGMLTIDPGLQAAGLGRRLLEAAEAWAREHGARVMRITVVSIRDTLISWYVRRGYAATGETEPFPYAETPFGAPKRADLEFSVMEKALQSDATAKEGADCT